MEFHEKLQELRKNKGMTQEDLASALYVSRTAISKWESGRGYPSLDSLREISAFFSISIDDLLSADALFTIAEEDRKTGIGKTYDSMFGIVDLFTFMMVVLPFYPEEIGGYVYAVNLLAYDGASAFHMAACWGLFAGLTLVGIIKLLMKNRDCRWITVLSLGLSVAAVLYLAMSREPYAVTMMFVLFLLKGILFVKYLMCNK